MKSTEYRLTDNLSLLEKVQNLLLIAKEGITSESVVGEIEALTDEHSEHTRLGKFFGHSVSDYAFAALKWLNTPASLEAFYSRFESLGDDRKSFINELIAAEGYKDI